MKRDPLDQHESHDLEQMLALLNAESQPNVNALSVAVRNINLAHLNIKAFGYDLARQLASALPAAPDGGTRHVGLVPKASVQADMESDWLAHWCAQLKIPVVFHRKLWELAYVLQAIFEHGHLQPSAKGLGFGCGMEPLPSYFASHGLSVMMTDLPLEDAQSRGWASTNQHASSLQQAHKPYLVSREGFDELVSLRSVDMNDIPDDLHGFDFCWSICALEHLGSIRKGLDFIENSLRTLRPGGVAVHTTEFNINPERPTVDNWPTVLFQRRHFQELIAKLRAQGHEVATPDFSLGDKPMDKFIDLPPWSHDLPRELNDWLGQPLHLKLGVDGFPCTCFGVIIKKAG
jgi:SAM-dependent methyltransferase